MIMKEFKRPFDYDNATEEERKEFRKWAFENPVLDKDEQWNEEQSDGFVPMKNQEQLRKELIEAAGWNIEARKTKKPVTINLDLGAVSYFKELAEETGISYQNLINLYLVQCAKEKKRPVFA